MGKIDYPFGKLGYEIRNAIKKDLDAKIIITSHNSKPGLSKTTLAIQMARAWDPHGWTADEKAFMDLYEYKDFYMNGKPGSVLVFDEIEGEADSRRAMSHKNVDLSQAWAQLRYRNMVSICTLPSVSMLDNRLLEMSDYWINVLDRGIAAPHKVSVNDYTGEVWRQQMGAEGNAIIRYGDLPDDDADYNLLKQMKDERNRTAENEWIRRSEADEEIEKAVEKARREVRNDFIRTIYDITDLTQQEISELDPVDISRHTVSDICQPAL